ARTARGVQGLVPAVEIPVVVGEDGVDQPLLLADALEETRRHAAAKDGIEKCRGVPRDVLLRKTARAETEMDLLELPLFAQHHVLCRTRRAPGPLYRRAGIGGEGAFQEGDD